MLIINYLSTLMMLILLSYILHLIRPLKSGHLPLKGKAYELPHIRIYLINKYFYGLIQLVVCFAKVFDLLHIVDDG